MQTAHRAIHRLALIACLGFLGGTTGTARPAHAAPPVERALPDSTLFLLKLNDAKNFRETFRGSQYGRLWNDPAMKDFRDDLVGKIDDASKGLKEKLGVSLAELFELPQGPVAIAAIAREDPKLPVAAAVVADAGTNQDKMLDVLTRATKQRAGAGAKVSEEAFNGLTLHVVQPPEDEDAGKDKDKDKDKEENKDEDEGPPPQPMIWSQVEGLFYFASDLNVIKDILTHRQGRDDSLAAKESFARTVAKVDAGKAQLVWFIDLARLGGILIKSSAKGNEGQAQQTEVLVEALGLKGLKSVGGCFTLGAGNYDSQSKTFFFAPRPVEGLLKMFAFTKAALAPEPWVPATVASYQTVSWDLSQAYEAIDQIVNKFQPGMLNLLEQQLVGPEGGEPLSFKNDVFGPLGNRVSLISDFKKPITEDSQRTLLAVGLRDAKAFQNTLSRVFEISHAAPRKREFQGATIYDFDLPALPNPNGGGQLPIKSISLSIAHDRFFVTTDTTLLEQILRPGNAALKDNAAYQTVAKEMPEQASGMSFIRPDESARLSYDLLKSGQLDKSIRQMMGGLRGPRPRQLPPVDQLFATEKLPDFSVIAKYLSIGGGYSIADDDGFTMTGFSLRPTGP